jgi:hypothetical protein
MLVVTIDGLPYVDAAWLQRRIAYDEARADRWQRKAEPLTCRADPDGQEMRRAYLTHALRASYSANRWRNALTVTLAAIQKRS